jgi:hypothetical protein
MSERCRVRAEPGVVAATDGSGASGDDESDGEELYGVRACEGAGVFWVGDQRQQVSAGGVAFPPRGVPYAYRMTSDSFDVITLCTLAGIERFFRAAGWDLSEPKPPGWEITPATWAAAAARAGQQIISPPLAEHEPSIPTDILARVTE